MSRGSAWSIRRYAVELWHDLVLHGIRKTILKHLTVNWNFNVLEMALKTFQSRDYPGHLYYLFFDISPTYFSQTFPRNIKTGIWVSQNPEFVHVFFKNLGLFRFSVCCKICSGNMLVAYRGITNKGVLERPGTKWNVLRVISSTLKFQFTVKC